MYSTTTLWLFPNNYCSLLSSFMGFSDIHISKISSFLIDLVILFESTLVTLQIKVTHMQRPCWSVCPVGISSHTKMIQSMYMLPTDHWVECTCSVGNNMQMILMTACLRKGEMSVSRLHSVSFQGLPVLLALWFLCWIPSHKDEQLQARENNTSSGICSSGLNY